MTLKDLRKICGGGENQFVEFKQYASEPTQITEEIVGFLNSRGGQLFVGVKDDGELLGLKFPEDDLNFLVDYINKHIRPKIELATELIPVTKKRAVVLFQVDEGEEKPYTLNTSTGNKKVFFRVADENIRASRELKSILYQKRKPQGRTIVYSDLEAAVLKEIAEHGSLTKADLVKKIEFNSRNISDCLIRLVTSKVLNIRPTNSGDLFEHNQSS